MTMGPITSAALAALERHRKEMRVERERLAAERAEREVIEDKETMAWVQEHPLCTEWLPGLTWQLVDRKFPQATAVIRCVEEPDILLIVSRDSAEVLVPRTRERGGAWLVGAHRCRCLADLGQVLYDRSRAET